MPGIALNAWVRMEAPASKAATAIVASASVWPDGSGRARGHDLPDRVEPAGQLRRDRDLADGAASGIEQEGDIRLRRVTQQRRFVRAVVPGVEERALEVRAQDVRIRLGEIGDERDTAGEGLQRRRHERDDRAGGAVRTMHLAPGADRLHAVVECGAGAAVAVDVDESGSEQGAGTGEGHRIDDLIRRGPLRSRPAAGDDAVLDADPAVLDDVAAVDDPCGVDDQRTGRGGVGDQRALQGISSAGWKSIPSAFHSGARAPTRTRKDSHTRSGASLGDQATSA